MTIAGGAHAILVRVEATDAEGPTRITARGAEGATAVIAELGPSAETTTTAFLPIGADGALAIGTTDAAVSVAIHLLGVVLAPWCGGGTTTLLADTRAADGGGPIGAGRSLDVALNEGGLPDTLMTSVAGLSLVAVDTEAQVEVLVDDTSLATYRVPAASPLVVTEIVPPSTTGVLSIRPLVGAVNARVESRGWFTSATAFYGNRVALGSAAVLPLGVPSPLQGTVTVDLPSDSKDAESIVLAITAAGGLPAVPPSVRLWSGGTPRPEEATVAGHNFGDTTTQLVVLRPGNGTAHIEASLGTDWSVALVGWSSEPPALNELADNTTVSDGTDVVLRAGDPASDTSTATIEYRGSDVLTEGSILTVPSTDELPSGLLVAVRDIIDDPTAPPGATVVETEPATLPDAIPNGEITLDQEITSADPGELPPDAPLPPDSPPGEPTTASSTTRSAKSSSSDPASSSVAGPQAASTNVSYEISRKWSAGCGGSSVSVNQSLRFSGRAKLSASWSPWGGARVSFDGYAGVSGPIRVSLPQAMSCSVTRTLYELSLSKAPKFVVPVGPVQVPVFVVPSVSGSLEVGVESATSVTAQVSAGVGVTAQYANRNATFNYSPQLSASADVDARASGFVRSSLGLRLSLMAYGVAGPYVEAGPQAKFTIDPAASPWWRLQGGLYAAAGLRLKVWKVEANWEGWRGDLLWPRNLGQAPGSFPGPVILTTTLPSGQLGVAYASSLQGSGGRTPYTWYRLSGSLPPGLRLERDGRVVGTPTATGNYGFRVRMIDAAGYRAAADRDVSLAIGTQPPPPTPTPNPPPPSPSQTVSISKGASAVGLSGCSHSSCRWINVSLRGFAANSDVTVVCRASNYPGGFYTTIRRVNSSGAADFAPCYYGFPGQTVWVTGNGVESNRIVW